MIRRPLVRTLMASAAIAAAVMLGGCDTDGNSPTLRSLQPISPQMMAEIDKRQMARESPILIRIFKEESELEVWKEDRSGRMAHLRTYPICRWSGDLGPKIREGDRQAPEGFYSITPNLLNPNSSFYLAINMGYPNAYDKANGRTGAFLMIHGDCSSRGCYAMTDEQISEIYALARESFFGGQGSFQIQAYPFRMTPLNMAKHRNSPHLAFWRMLKQGYDHFEVTRQEVKVDVCEKRYVFNAEGDRRPNPTAKCPVMQFPDDVVAAVRDKENRDNAQVAELIRKGTPATPARTVDGGMHATFRGAVSPHSVDEDGVVRHRIASAHGTIPANIRMPGANTGAGARSSSQTTGSVGSQADMPPAEPEVAWQQKSSGSSPGVFGNLFASNGTSQQSSGGVMDRMSRMIGWSSAPAAAPAPKPKSKPNQATARAKPAKSESAPSKQVANAGAIRPKAEPKAETQQAAAAPAPAAPAGQSNSLLSGAQPTVPTGGFDNRFGAWR